MSLFYKKLKAFLIHLLMSTLVIGPFFLLIYFVWYPAPFQYLEGVTQVTIILLLAGLILGPILTFALYKPGKKGLVGDIVLIAIIQVGAFTYGANVIYSERPMYVSFSYDQFKTIQAKKVNLSSIQNEKIKSNLFKGPLYVNVKMPDSSAELVKVLSGKMQGDNVYEMAQFYQPLKQNFAMATRHAKGINLGKLLKKFPDQALRLQQVKNKTQLNNEQLMLLPVMGSSEDMVIIFDRASGSPLGHILVSPWDLK